MTCDVCGSEESEQAICEACLHAIRLLSSLQSWQVETMLLLGNISEENANAYRWAWRNREKRFSDVYRGHESKSMEAVALLHTIQTDKGKEEF